MDITNFPPGGIPASDWQVLGEFKLLLRSNVDDPILRWLTLLLQPLQLQPEFLNRILKSARDATTRILQSGLNLEHIHLMIYVPQDRTAKGQTWGFFRVEKVEGLDMGKSHPEHAVEFYLYLEG